MFGFRYPAVVVLCFIAAGTIAGRHVWPGLTILSALAVGACLGLIFVYVRLLRPYFVIPLAMVMFFGAWNRAATLYQVISPDDISRIACVGKTVTFFGGITSWPEIKRERTLITCRMDSVVIGDSIRVASGLVLVVIRRETTGFTFGDRIRFIGRLIPPRSAGYPGSFDYGRYLDNRGIRGLIYIADPSRVAVDQNAENRLGRGVAELRRWITRIFTENLSDVSAAMATGFLIGETRNIPESLYQSFRRTGTMHLLAVSGSNVALVLAVVIFLLRYFPLGRWPRLIILLGIVILFCNLSNNQPSVVRASVVAGLVLIARAVYRRADLNNILALAAAGLLLYDPGNLFDVGFQLSFATAWGLVLFLPPINDLFIRFRWPTWMRYLLLLFSTSFIASLISTPITLAYFGEASSVTVFSNMIVVPLVSLAVIGIMILLLVAVTLPALAIGPGILLDRLLHLTQEVVSWFARLEWAEIAAPSLPAAQVILLLAMVCCLFAAIRHRAARRILVFIVLGGAVVHVAVAIGRPARMPDIEIFNYGLSQTILVNRAPGAAVYHPGGSGRFDDFTVGVLPYLAGRGIPPPEYYIFFEPRYQTEVRLVRWADEGAGFPLARVAAPRQTPQPALYRRTSILDSSNVETAGEIIVDPDGVMITLGDSCQLVFAEAVESALRAAGPETGGRRHYFLFVDDNTELDRALTEFNGSGTVILLTKRSDSYNLLSDKALDDYWPYFQGYLIEKGASLTIDLRALNESSDRNFPAKN